MIRTQYRDGPLLPFYAGDDLDAAETYALQYYPTTVAHRTAQFSLLANGVTLVLTPDHRCDFRCHNWSEEEQRCLNA